MRHIWSLLCESTAVDGETNSLSISNVRESIEIKTGPIPEAASGNVTALPLPHQLQVVSVWARTDLDTPETGSIRITLQGSGEPQTLAEADLDLTEHRRSRMILSLVGVPIDIGTVGRREILFRIEQADAEGEWSTETTVPLEITVSRSAEMPSAAPLTAPF